MLAALGNAVNSGVNSHQNTGRAEEDPAAIPTPETPEEKQERLKAVAEKLKAAGDKLKID